MPSHRHDHPNEPSGNRNTVIAALARIDRVLPAQAPIQNFVHHNTLHGFQHLPFEEALAEAEKLTGIAAYLPEAKSREFYRQGRINDDDLMAALEQMPSLNHTETVSILSGKTLFRKDLYRIALVYGIEKISLSHLNWQIEELSVLDNFQEDVPADIRQGLNTDVTQTGQHPIRQIWETICTELDLKHEAAHPETLSACSIEQARQWIDSVSDDKAVHPDTQASAKAELHNRLTQIGDTLTLREFITALCGRDVLNDIRPQLIRLCASVLDEGIAPWRLTDFDGLGLYGGWRALAQLDAYPFLHDLPDWPHIMAGLPADAVDNIVLQLEYFEIPSDRWSGYLQRVALEMPGWAGMINWRQRHTEFGTRLSVSPTLADFLAIRLTLDRLWLNQVCRDIWKCEARLGSLQRYFSKNSSEFLVRQWLQQGALPEHLNHEAELLVIRAGSERQCRQAWQHLADLIAIGRLGAFADKPQSITANDTAWRLFRLCQHLGLRPQHISELGRSGLLELIDILDRFDHTVRRRIWLTAYERHYREDLLNALHAHRHRAETPEDDSRNDVAQVIMCMDEREESFRRHLEELNPRIETFGAAGFFGIPMNYKSLDAKRSVPLCPVAVSPKNEVMEVARSSANAELAAHEKGYRLYLVFKHFFYHDLRRHPIVAHLGFDILAPMVLIQLIGKSFFPGLTRSIAAFFHRLLIPPVRTELDITVKKEHTHTEQDISAGFSDNEQADRVQGLLKVIGLTSHFAPIVALIGHGSTSRNNPHEAAHDCGACGGRQGGPNARAFAAMANRHEVREILNQRGIVIPSHCRFIGMQHDTCNDSITYFDLADVPSSVNGLLDNFKNTVRRAQAMSAHERCRRFASSGYPISPEEAFAHVTSRAQDFSQVRPEYGHASNACAIIGRRRMTKGLFLDRRPFLISYDPDSDPDGEILESILLTAAPVGAGINLEYYFSTVDNDRFGCGTKIPHNITGLFGVMEGTASDLRTGLPRQMIEIHEAMRLLIVVESTISRLEKIYARQESLRELIAGRWVHLCVIEPATGDIYLFDPQKGFTQRPSNPTDLPIFSSSTAYYRDRHIPLPPAMIRAREATV